MYYFSYLLIREVLSMIQNKTYVEKNKFVKPRYQKDIFNPYFNSFIIFSEYLCDC
jgi:hypothetical protein